MMSRKDYRAPIRPPRSGKVSKDTSGRLMNIIAELSVSKSNDDRKHRMQLLTKDFESSDARLVQLIGGHRDELNLTMELFSKISAKINASRRSCHSIKEKLLVSKSLLQCKRDEIKKLSDESIEHRDVLSMLKEIGELTKVSEKVEKHLKHKEFIEATELLVSSTAMLNGKLSGADALKELKVELEQLRKNLHQVLVQELHNQLYMSPAEVFKCDVSETFFKNKSFEEDGIQLPVEGQYFDFSKGSEIYEQIGVVIKCISELNTLSETVEILKEKFASKELLHIIKRSSQWMYDTVENSPNKNGTFMNIESLKHSKEQQECLLQLLEMILKQFRYVAVNHYYLLDNLQRIAMTKGLTDISLEMADIYSKLQTAVEIFISKYLDLNNTSAIKRSTIPFSKVQTATDISSYFLRKNVTRVKKHSLFQFDCSSHAINTKNYLQEQKELNQKANNVFGGELLDSDDLPVLVCEPSIENITVLYKPCKKFITEVENALHMDPATHCPLHSFLNDCIQIFFDESINMNINRLLEKISNDNFEPVTDIDELKSVDAKTQILSSTVALQKNLKELQNLIYLIPDYSGKFLKLICNLLSSYKELTNQAYKSLIYSDYEQQQLFSVSWAKDSDISRLLRSLPNSKNLRETEETEFEESPEDIRLRNKEESELLMRNLSCKECIAPGEIISDYNKLKNLAFVHESMEWLSLQILQFADSLPDLQASVPSFLAEKVNNDSNGNLEISVSTKSCLKSLAKDYEELADTALLVLHLEVRSHCFYHLIQLPKMVYSNRKNTEEPEPQVIKLNTDLSKIDEALAPVLQPKKMKYIFEGVGELLSTILINCVSRIKKINENGIKKMGRNIFAIQQNLAGITMTREVALDRARQFFDLLNHSYEEIFNQIVEEGPQFQEQEYSAVLQLLYNSREGQPEQQPLNYYLDKLRQILDEVAVSV